MERIIVIEAKESGLSLDQLLCRRFPEFSKSQWIAQFKAGLICRGAQRMRPHFRLPAGAELKLSLPAEQGCTPVAVMNLEIILQTDEIMVVQKPAQITVHPTDQTPPGSTLLEQVWQQTGDRLWQLVHRLDHGTSGVLLLAKGAKALAYWQEELSKPTTHKIYQAWVWGQMPEASGVIDAPLSKIKGGKVQVDTQGLQARTHYQVLQTEGSASLLELRLEQGRSHQIRAHLAYFGCPIIGDRIYGSDPVLDRQFKAKRIYLHALSLQGDSFNWNSPLPGAFEGLIQRLQRASLAQKL